MPYCCCKRNHTGPKMASLHLLLLFFCWCSSDAYRILGIFPTPSWSHQEAMQVVMKALAKRGHQITVITPNPLPVPLANYTEIDISFSYEHLRNHLDFTNLPDNHGRQFIKVIFNYLAELTEVQLSSKPVQDFIRTNKEKFDMVIYEPHGHSAYFGLVHKLGSPPSVGILSLGSMTPDLVDMGNPDNPAYIPDWPNPFSDHMTFWERMYSTWFKLWIHFYLHWIAMPKQEAIMRKLFGDAPPPVAETEKNKSLLLVNNHWSLDYPRPLLPNVVSITGLHLKLKTNPLPKDIQHFLDEAKDGAIYFSLGSNVRSDKLTPEIVAEILATFAELPQRIIWKWESDTLAGKPSNVMTGKWLPQEDILAHPNIRAFIFQGGLQSFQEAAYYGVPLIAIPFFSDQYYNARRVEYSGIGVQLHIKDLTKTTFLEAIKKVLHDPSYRTTMKQVSTVYREEVAVSLDKAVWWIEYILRHKGAPHLRSAALDLTWYQYLLLDVIAAIILALAFFLAIVYGLLRILFSLLCGNSSKSSRKKKVQ